MRILFYDVATPYTYTSETVNQTAIGGTEATITRIAEGLSAHHDVMVAQHCRESSADCEVNQVHYISFATARAKRNDFDIVIMLRDQNHLEKTAQLFTNAKLFFWMHNTPAKNLFQLRSILLKYHYQIIAVSHYHQDLIEKRLNGKWHERILHFRTSHNKVPVRVVYNPIAENLFPDKTQWQPNKLLFLSSPQKGLAETLKMFQQVLEAYPEYHLYIGNPGHRHIDLTLPKQTSILGPLPHHQVIQHLREAFCVFYPQYLKAETFGLVYAEANAVGTPVLAHHFGAAPEVLNNPEQLINGRNIKEIIGKLTEWREARPVLHGKEEFLLKNVLKQWQNLLSS